jgi:hypothetical protein
MSRRAVVYLAPFISEIVPTHRALSWHPSWRALIRLEQSNSTWTGCLIHSTARRTPSRHALASAFSGEPQCRMNLQVVRSTPPSYPRATTPMLAFSGGQAKAHIGVDFCPVVWWLGPYSSVHSSSLHLRPFNIFSRPAIPNLLLPFFHSCWHPISSWLFWSIPRC